MKHFKKILILMMVLFISVIAYKAYNRIYLEQPNKSVLANNIDIEAKTLENNSYVETNSNKIDEKNLSKELYDDQENLEELKLEKKLKFQEQRKIEKQSIKEKETIKTVKTTSTQKQKQTTTPSVGTLLVDKIQGVENSQQAIIVTSDSSNSYKATIRTFERTNGVWKQIHTMPAVIGKFGFTTNKKEGDKKSPAGIYTIGTAFGRQPNPGTKLPYRQTTSNDYWVDDSKSPLYNTLQEAPVNGRWDSAESMNIKYYDYGFVINYNTAERIPYKGSAIFFHIWIGSSISTTGCTATSEDNLLKIMKWLDPSKNPVFIQGTMSQVLNNFN